MSDEKTREQRNRAIAAARDYNPYPAEFLEHEFETYDLMPGTPLSGERSAEEIRDIAKNLE